MAIAKIWRQHVEIKITRPFNVIISTIEVETVVAPNINFVRSGVLSRSVMNLGCGLGGFLEGRTLNRSSKVPALTTRVVGTP